MRSGGRSEQFATIEMKNKEIADEIQQARANEDFDIRELFATYGARLSCFVNTQTSDRVIEIRSHKHCMQIDDTTTNRCCECLYCIKARWYTGSDRICTTPCLVDHAESSKWP